MRKSTAARFAVWGTTLFALAALAIAATGATGAYFSDTHTGAITGALGSIKITPTGGTGASNMNFAFANMLPGVSQSAGVHYVNTGANSEDVWLVFNNATALSALNNLGTYGEVHVSANGSALFDSANLNDNSTSCGPFSASGCWPLPKQIKVDSNVAPLGAGNLSFAFNYAGKLSNAAEGGTFNLYPVAGQFTTNAADGTGNGLPYEIVATQVGQTP